MYCFYTVGTSKVFAVVCSAVLSLVFSLRAIYGTDDLRNGLHGSLSVFSAEREIRFMFPRGKMMQKIYVLPAFGSIASFSLIASVQTLDII